MNGSEVKVPEFVLNCFNEVEEKSLTGVILLFMYLVTLLGNLLVFLTIVTDHQLQKPMFLCIVILSVIDLFTSTNVILKIVAVLLFNSTHVSYGTCFLQMYILHHMEVLEFFLLALMAFDRYIAVLNPLRYPSIVTARFIFLCFVASNVLGFIIVVAFIIFAANFSFCSTNIIPYCFCDFTAMARIACVEDAKYDIMSAFAATAFISFSFTTILFSYTRIIQAVLKIKNVDGRTKALSTCVTHLTVVCLFYIPLFIAYVIPLGGDASQPSLSSTLIMISTIIPPMFNPIIYSFRNKEIKQSMYRIITGKRIATFSISH